MNTPATRVATAVDSLFRRWPSLVGFSVQRFERELVLADIETIPWPGRTRELYGEIAAALLNLIDDEPATRELLLGRTFARSLH